MTGVAWVGLKPAMWPGDVTHRQEADRDLIHIQHGHTVGSVGSPKRSARLIRPVPRFLGGSPPTQRTVPFPAGRPTALLLARAPTKSWGTLRRQIVSSVATRISLKLSLTSATAQRVVVQDQPTQRPLAVNMTTRAARAARCERDREQLLALPPAPWATQRRGRGGRAQADAAANATAPTTFLGADGNVDPAAVASLSIGMSAF